MKKHVLSLLFLFLCFCLTACGQSRGTIFGEVVDIHQDPKTGTALILQTDDGPAAVLLETDTLVGGTVDLDGDAYKAAPHTGVQLYFVPDGSAGSLTMADGKTVHAYHAAGYISLESYLVENAVTLSDGTPLDVWKSDTWGNRYQLKDGTVLLRENPPYGPENVYVGNLAGLDDFSEAAKSTVLQYYAEQGQLYDLQNELERAYDEYTESPKDFSSHLLEQRTAPAAASDQVMYFTTILTLPVSGNIIEEVRFLAAFDRKTGTLIPTANLFTCGKDEIGPALLDLAAKNGSLPDDPSLKLEMAAAFQMEYLDISSDSLCIVFPQGTLLSEEHTYIISIDLTDDMKALFQPWAVPNSQET